MILFLALIALLCGEPGLALLLVLIYLCCKD